jgi:hypothetical protein
MGINVHTHLAVQCDSEALELVRQLAKAYLPKLPDWEDADDGEKLAVNLLTWLSSPEFTLFKGNGGDLLLWGYIRGYITYVDEFIEILRENGFWADLLRLVHGTKKPYLSSRHIVVFEEREQTEQTIAYEIKVAEDEQEKRLDTVTVKRHKCPFCFYQM